MLRCTQSLKPKGDIIKKAYFMSLLIVTQVINLFIIMYDSYS